MYLVGGYSIEDEQVKFNKKILKLPLSTLTWEAVEYTGKLYAGSMYAKIFTISLLSEDTIYMLPGLDNNENIKTTQAFNITKSSIEGSLINTDTMHYSATVFESFFYIFGGGTQTYSNKLLIIDPMKAENSVLSENYILPEPRNFASLVSIEQSLYMFGGSSENKEYFNDMWKFSTITNTWEKVETTGTLPGARSQFGYISAGYRIFIYGGIGSEYFSDLFEYNSFANNWKSLDENIEVKPVGRSGACIAYLDDNIYIYGGTKNSVIFTDLWVFNLKTVQYSELSSGPNSEVQNSCIIDKTANVLYVVSTPSSYCYKKIMIYNIINDTWQLVDNSVFKGSGSTDFIIKGQLISIGGSMWNSHLKKSISTFDILTSKTSSFTMKIGFYGSVATHFSDSLYIFGGVLLKGNILGVVSCASTLIKLKLEEVLLATHCSPGTYLENGECVLCPSGKYSKFVNSEQCLECSRGSYSKIKGATSLQQCLPCSAETWNNLTGQSFCRDCPSNFFCPYGSSYPSEFQVISEDSYTQPDSYKEQTLKYTYYSTLAAGLIAALFCVGLVGVIFLTKIRQKLYLVDIYTNLHNHKHLVPMYIKKTNLGGCCSIVFITSAFTFILLTVIRYEFLNIVEIRTLVPLVTVSDTFKSDFEFEVSLYYYGGDCEGENDKCTPLSSIESSGMNRQLTSECKKDGQTCIIKMKCTDCEVITSSSILLKFFEEYSFCSYISVNLTSSTSIPDKKSTVRLFTTSDSNTYFKGTVPTIFTFSLIPTLFKSDTVDSSGYHISKDVPVIKGSQYKSEGFSYGSGLSIEIDLAVSNTCLHISRGHKMTQAELFSALIGTIFGFLSSIGGLMNYSEKYYENLSSWLYHKSALKYYYRRIRRIMSILYQGNSIRSVTINPSIYSASKFGMSDSFYDDQTLFRSKSTIK